MAKFTRLYRIACAGLQTILYRASVHAGDFRAISVTKLKCASPISYCVGSHYRIVVHTILDSFSWGELSLKYFASSLLVSIILQSTMKHEIRGAKWL